MFGGRGEFSAYAMDSISMRQERTSSEADGRSQVSSASSGGAAASSAAAAEELEAMKEKLGMFMLGGDMSGGQGSIEETVAEISASTTMLLLSQPPPAPRRSRPANAARRCRSARPGCPD